MGSKEDLGMFAIAVIQWPTAAVISVGAGQNTAGVIAAVAAAVWFRKEPIKAYLVGGGIFAASSYAQIQALESDVQMVETAYSKYKPEVESALDEYRAMKPQLEQAGAIWKQYGPGLEKEIPKAKAFYDEYGNAIEQDVAHGIAIYNDPKNKPYEEMMKDFITKPSSRTGIAYEAGGGLGMTQAGALFLSTYLTSAKQTFDSLGQLDHFGAYTPTPFRTLQPPGST